MMKDNIKGIQSGKLLYGYKTLEWELASAGIHLFCTTAIVGLYTTLLSQGIELSSRVRGAKNLGKLMNMTIIS
jgi:hypothetical protein